MPLCESAKVGKVCIDDLCRGSPDETLCGFNADAYAEMTEQVELYEDEGE